MNGEPKYQTAILPVDVGKIGTLRTIPRADDLLDSLAVDLDPQNEDAANLLLAAEQLKHSDIPVAFPTETVYGLGADATRSAAVKGIYKAKQRPADNPLIVHFASLKQLRDLLRSRDGFTHVRNNISNAHHRDEDPIPEIYHPLISKFWPGPLTIILPNPPDSPLAPEVTAGLSTFGARMPRHVLALALIQQAGVPLAAPSANASTKPSPTAAEHVALDLDGRIQTIIDGGPCDVGVESTVVDGLSDPPVILRPGGISIEQLRSCPGWENTQIGYKNMSEEGTKPKAPGMKYRHYSPKAPVILFGAGKDPPTPKELEQYHQPGGRVGVITTKHWQYDSRANALGTRAPGTAYTNGFHRKEQVLGFAGMLDTVNSVTTPKATLKSRLVQQGDTEIAILEIQLGAITSNIARGIFAALRELDCEGVDAIFVEGIDDDEGETAAAVMNRLRKAAEVKIDQ
jgi:L-threonylcarbamoyladenylate synthase